MKYAIYDLEFFPNYFCGVFREFTKNETEIKYTTFEISVRKDERVELLEFLSQDGLSLIGYNNVAYDYPVLHYLIENPDTKLSTWFRYVNTKIIGSDMPVLWESEHTIPQIDLFLIHHYNNRARMTSLKWLEFTTRWKKVQDLPMTPAVDVPLDKFDEMLLYCKNDVDFTYKFTSLSRNAIRFRINMSKGLRFNVMNYSDVKIGEYLNRKTYARLSGRKWRDFKQLRTFHKVFHLKDIIPNGIEFKTEYMQGFLNEIKDKSFKEDESFDRHVTIGDCVIKFAKGGLHSEDESRIVKCKEGWFLTEKDIASMYSKTMINDEIFPEHLGVEWNEGINELYEKRLYELKPKLKVLEYQSDEWNEVNDEQESIKLSLNGGSFGKLGSKYSWQYDPLAKFKVTIGGELKMLMLIEDFDMVGIEIISVNTDGVVIHYPKEKQEIVDKIHSEWEAKTNYLLEDTFYKQIIFSTVNDYIAEIIDPETGECKKVKFKGDFEIDKDYHKNNSQRIVAIALMEHYINGVDIKDVIRSKEWKFTNSRGESEHTSIYDFCIGRKKTRNCMYYLIDNGRALSISDKVIRYYISNSRNYLLKKYTSGKKSGDSQKINAGFNVNMFMDYDKKEEYNVNYLYYEQECMKFINPIRVGTNRLENPPAVQQKMF